MSAMSRLPRCPVCGHLLRSDNAEGWICSARGGCRSEFAAEQVEKNREVFYASSVLPTMGATPMITPDTAAPKPLPTKAPEGLRTFTLSRQADSSGVSGTGVVMQGVQFATGRVVVQWLTPFPGGSINIFDSLGQLLDIHVHSHPDNGTTLTFSDGEVVQA